MIPLKDNIPSRRYPVVNVTLIASCSVVFLLQLTSPEGGSLVERYGMIPARVLHPERPIQVTERVRVRTSFGTIEREMLRDAEAPPFSPWLTLVTCIFLHGGWLHFLGNMWFLHIFGDNVEDRYGHLGFLLLYMGTGLAASVAHLLSSPSSTLPTVGASGAIAGVMGAYLFLFPHARVFTLLPFFLFFYVIVLPAGVFLGIWFFLQFFQGSLSITSAETGGVAWWAHIGGFLTGLLVTIGLRKRWRELRVHWRSGEVEG